MTQRGRLILFLALLAAGFIYVGAILLAAHRHATEVFTKQEVESLLLMQALKEQKTTCPAVFGKQVPGNGWKALLKALRGFRDIPDEELHAIPEVSGRFPAENDDFETLEEIFTEHGSILDDLRFALRHSEMDPEYDYAQDLNGQLAIIPDPIPAAQFVTGAAGFYHRMGQNERAVELFKMGLGLAQSIARKGPLYQILHQGVCEDWIIEGWRKVLESSHPLSAADLDRAALGIEALWQSRTRLPEAYRVEGVIRPYTLAEMGLHGYDPSMFDRWTIGRSWRFWFSRRLAYADALPTIRRFFDEVQPLFALPMGERKVAACTIEEEIQRSTNPLVPITAPPLVNLSKLEAIRATSWTLMRVATALACSQAEKGSMPEALKELVPRYLRIVPESPLSGRPLGYSSGKVWSSGVDGIDHGGKRSPKKDDEDPGYDIVWSVGHR